MAEAQLGLQVGRPSRVVRPSRVDRGRAYRAAGAREIVFDWPSPADEPTLVALAGPVRAALAAVVSKGA